LVKQTLGGCFANARRMGADGAGNGFMA
jgi:hypothetical protein